MPTLLTSILTLVLSGTLAAGAEPAATPLRPASPPEGKTLFTALPPERSGIDFVNPIDKQHPLKRIYLGAFACGGIAIGDLNGDGRPDLFLTSGARPNRPYLQSETPPNFDDATRAAGRKSGV